MNWILLVVLILIVAIGFFGSRKRQFERRPKVSVDDHVTFPIRDFRARSVSGCKSACSAVKKIEGRRYLIHETPTLPVEGCESGNCECTYIDFVDRRSGDRDKRRVLSPASKNHEEFGVERRRRPPERRGDL